MLASISDRIVARLKNNIFATLFKKSVNLAGTGYLPGLIGFERKTPPDSNDGPIVVLSASQSLGQPPTSASTVMTY